MLIDKYLVIEGKKSRYSYNGFTPHVRLVEREPTLSGNEIAIRIKVEIPDALFKRPTLVAEMRIPNEAVPQTTITPDVTTNIESIIKERTGLDMAIYVVPYKEKEEETPAAEN